MKLDAATFERVTRKRNFEPRTLEIAKRLIVRGESARALAHEYGMHEQRVYNIRKRVLEAYQAELLPPGWIEITVSGPKEMMLRFQREAAAAHAKWKKTASKT